MKQEGHSEEFQKRKGVRHNFKNRRAECEISKAQEHKTKFQRLEGRREIFKNRRAYGKISKNLRVKILETKDTKYKAQFTMKKPKNTHTCVKVVFEFKPLNTRWI